MTGQEAVNVAADFDNRIGIDGVILSKSDSDTRGGAALSVKAVTGKPILFVGMGEKLSDLERRLRGGEITFRPAYQELSVTIRDFVKDISGIDLTKCTLSELKLKNVPVVSSLIETYYEPEFAVETDDDVYKAIFDARTVIERWI